MLFFVLSNAFENSALRTGSFDEIRLKVGTDVFSLPKDLAGSTSLAFGSQGETLVAGGIHEIVLVGVDDFTLGDIRWT